MSHTSPSRDVVFTAEAPEAIGPYSQAIIANGLVFCSGQIPIVPATGKIIEGDVRAQTQRVIENLSAVLTAAGTSLSKVVKTTIYLKDLQDFVAVNEVYGTFFRDKPPARATVQVARLPRDVQVEIDAIAVL